MTSQLQSSRSMWQLRGILLCLVLGSIVTIIQRLNLDIGISTSGGFDDQRLNAFVAKPLKSSANVTTGTSTSIPTTISIRNGSLKGQGKDSLELFHLVHTTDDDSFTERNVKVLESIFFHHPQAHVKLHVHNLTSQPIQGLVDAGYSIKLVPIDLKGTIQRLINVWESPLSWPSTWTDYPKAALDDFVKQIPSNYSQTKYWYTNQSNLLRLALMYLEGGVYMDTDVILIKPLYQTSNGSDRNPAHRAMELTNIVGWEDKYHLKINMAVMKFTKATQQSYNPFLAACLKDFFENFQPLIWGHNGPKLITRVFWQHTPEGKPPERTKGESKTALKKMPETSIYSPSSMIVDTLYNPSNASDVWLQVLDHRAFYPIRANNVRKWCFRFYDQAPDKIRQIEARSWGVHTNNKNTGQALLQPGSVCHWLHLSFGVLNRTSAINNE